MEDAEGAELVGRLFALMTAKLEDAALVAVDGQSPKLTQRRRVELAEQLSDAAEELITLAQAAAALCDRTSA